MTVEEFIALTLVASTSLMAIVKEPGVADLPASVKGKFGQAIRAERSGKPAAEVNRLLDAAVDAELALA